MRRAGESIADVWLRNVFLIIVLVFMAAPIVLVVANSFNASSFNAWPPREWTTQWYEKLFSYAPFWHGAMHSLVIAITTTVMTLLVGVPAAFAIARWDFPGRTILRSLIHAPMVVPRVVIGFALFMFFISARLPLYGTWEGIALSHVMLSLPIAVTILSANFINIDPTLEEAARDLGANRVQAFTSAVLPQLRSGLFVAGTFAFITSFDEVETTLFLVSPSLNTLPIEMYHYLEFQQDPMIAAASTVLIVCTLFVVLAALLGGHVSEMRRSLSDGGDTAKAY